MKERIRELARKKANCPWKRVIFHTIEGFFSKEISKKAASLTYYMIFVIFPCLILISSVLAFLNLPMIFETGEVQAVLPAEVITLINITLSHMTDTYNGGWFTFGLAFSLWFAWRAMKNLVFDINYIYEEKKGKYHMIRIGFLAVLIIIFIPVYVLVLLIGQGFLEFVSIFIPLADRFIELWDTVRFLPLTVGIFIFISSIYTLSLENKPPRKCIFLGAFLSTLAWLIFSLGFVYYVDHMGRYSLVYGSIGTIIAFLVWLNASVIALMMGAVFNQSLRREMEHRI